MVKTLKRILLSSASILAISFLIWTVLLVNPNLSYANKTQFDNVTVFHNQQLEDGTETIIKDALKIIENSEIYSKDLKIQFCLNDDKIYPNLNPFAGANAYAFMNKTVLYACIPKFNSNYTEFSWEINNYELRKYNLTSLLAHEFMHNAQYKVNPRYYFSSTLGRINWKFEGHAEYIAREFKNDGQLQKKLARYLVEEKKEHLGVPVFILEDETIQNLSYFKYSLVIQYLIEVKSKDYKQICDMDDGFDELFAEMVEWSQNEGTPTSR